LGSADYALINDFTTNVDKLQVRAGTAYLTTPSTSGKNQDELIAVLQGVTALGSADLTGVRSGFDRGWRDGAESGGFPHRGGSLRARH
jgi:hypothetical protein